MRHEIKNKLYVYMIYQKILHKNNFYICNLNFNLHYLSLYHTIFGFTVIHQKAQF